MGDGPYLHPVGLLYGEVARAAISQEDAGALAGGAIGFPAARIISGSSSAQGQETRSYRDLDQAKEPAIVETLERLKRPRSRLAGLSFDAPKIMGVVNVTPDSFSDGGLYDWTEQAISRAAQLTLEGADIVDIGGESTRPGADPVNSEDELERVLPVIDGLKGSPTRISIDTRKARVMVAAERAGVRMINDVSALTFDPESMAVVAKCDLPVVLMHAKGDPKTMQDEPVYDDVVLEVYDYLSSRIAACAAAGISSDRLIADPGIGFGKRLGHNLELFAGLSLFHGLGVPLMVGASRKSFIGALTGERDPLQRVCGSVAAALAAMAQGVQLVRVHDVSETAQARSVWQAAISGKVEVGTKT